MSETIERAKAGLESLIDRTRDAVVGAADGAEKRVEVAAGRVVERAHTAGERLRGGAERASRGACQHVDRAAESLDSGMGAAKSELSRAARAATDYVVANPGKAVLLATAAGFVLGLLARRRRSPG
jgi:ElaB/YqjD/DUF883 family membrane-anchored ribosome-binding protein